MKKFFRHNRKASIYLLALLVLLVMGILGLTLSRMATSGRWHTVFSGNHKKAEDLAESANTLTFKMITDEMNCYDSFWDLFKFEGDFFNSWFMFFRLPMLLAEAEMTPATFPGADVSALSANLDLFKKFYEIEGKPLVYSSANPEQTTFNSAIHALAEKMDGSCQIVSTARIKSVTGILSEKKEYRIPGLDIPVGGANGFIDKFLDKISFEGGIDFNLGELFNLEELLPETPLIEAPNVKGWTITVQSVVIPIGYLIQPIIDKIFEKIFKNFTIKKLAGKLFDNLGLQIDFTKISDRIKEGIKGALPEKLQLFCGTAGYGITMEKKGILQITTEVSYWPRSSKDKQSNERIRKKLVTEREFRVADIQGIAPNYSFFIANSALAAENDIEAAGWEGDEKIDFDNGAGELVIHNFPSLKELIQNLKSLFTLKIKELSREVKLLGLVRVNGTKPMPIKIGMFKTMSDQSQSAIKGIEALALVAGHSSSENEDHSEIACQSLPAIYVKKHDDTNKHRLIPQAKAKYFPTNFDQSNTSFDWPFFGGSKHGSFFLPFPPRFPRNRLFGNFHIEVPLSLRVEGNLQKVYSHINLCIVKFVVAWPVPPIYFEIPLPFFRAWRLEEPYGFCNKPPYKDAEEASTKWDPNKPENLPANLYGTSQYIKKASYFYATSADFNSDIKNRSILYEGESTFICDGVTYVNDNLDLPAMRVMGRGMIVAPGNITLKGNITRVAKDQNGNQSIFSIISRSGAVIPQAGCSNIDACVYADRGVKLSMMPLSINGNLVINRFNRGDITGSLEVYYQSSHCRSSLLSMIRPVAKYDPTRYYTSVDRKTSKFEFQPPD
ncbi:MAG: hypothetical protein GX221_04790 [Candidatus Riflebacteria bacterium]|nr:hypothetical protein [Candidatus Riflebacteria bacterium]